METEKSLIMDHFLDTFVDEFLDCFTGSCNCLG